MQFSAPVLIVPESWNAVLLERKRLEKDAMPYAHPTTWSQAFRKMLTDSVLHLRFDPHSLRPSTAVETGIVTDGCLSWKVSTLLSTDHALDGPDGQPLWQPKLLSFLMSETEQTWESSVKLSTQAFRTESSPSGIVLLIGATAGSGRHTLLKHHLLGTFAPNPKQLTLLPTSVRWRWIPSITLFMLHTMRTLLQLIPFQRRRRAHGSNDRVRSISMSQFDVEAILLHFDEQGDHDTCKTIRNLAPLFIKFNCSWLDVSFLRNIQNLMAPFERVAVSAQDSVVGRPIPAEFFQGNRISIKPASTAIPLCRMPPALTLKLLQLFLHPLVQAVWSDHSLCAAFFDSLKSVDYFFHLDTARRVCSPKYASCSLGAAF
jgi:hypothetical protein